MHSFIFSSLFTWGKNSGFISNAEIRPRHQPDEHIKSLIGSSSDSTQTTTKNNVYGIKSQSFLCGKRCELMNNGRTGILIFIFVTYQGCRFMILISSFLYGVDFSCVWCYISNFRHSEIKN